MAKKPKVLLIGWDAADWKVINPLMDQGLMPALESLVNRGSIGNIATLDPPLSPMLWTSIATGKRAYDHGIMGFLESDADGKQLQPMSSASRKVKAIWEILNQEGYKTQIYGWWPSYPAEPVDGIMVSNFFGKAPKNSWHDEYPLNETDVHPPELRGEFEKLRVHPSEIGAYQIAPFIPDFNKIDLEKDKVLEHLISDLAECLSIHSAATYGIENHDWDFAAVYYNAIDHLSHVFMKYHPPKQDHIEEEKYELYKEVINSTYRFHDMMLARMLELVDEDTHVIVMSDHGFHSDHLRLTQLPKEPAAIAREHNPLGMIAVAGPGIKKDERFYGSSLLDVTPTILQMFNLAVGLDMEGKVLVTAFEEQQNIDFIDSWEDVGKPREAIKRQVGVDGKEALQQLIDLGYVEAPDEENPKGMQKQLDENLFYLARAYADGSRFLEAADLLERLLVENPENHRYRMSLIKCYLNVSESAQAAYHLEQLQPKIRENLMVKAMEADVLISLGKKKSAESILAELVMEKNDILAGKLGEAYVKLEKWHEALAQFEMVLETNQNDVTALHGRGLCLLKLEKYEEALDSLLDSIGLLYQNPSAHFHLGECLYLMGAYEEASQAFKLTLHLAPGMAIARQMLIKIYSDHLPDPEQVEELRAEMVEEAVEERIIVSGLPRSGTSMMMQILEAAGIEPFTDNRRKSDESNPKGYYEHDAIKLLASNNEPIHHAGGKATKVIAQLLPFLPMRYSYKIIFMKRDLDEVIQSQETMLKRLGKLNEESAVFNMKEAFESSLKRVERWAEPKRNVEILYLIYKDCVNDPEKAAEVLTEFLGREISEPQILRVVDSKLYRNKA